MPEAVVKIAVTELLHIQFANVFDMNPDLLGLPDGKVRELRTGVIRECEAGRRH